MRQSISSSCLLGMLLLILLLWPRTTSLASGWYWGSLLVPLLWYRRALLRWLRWPDNHLLLLGSNLCRRHLSQRLCWMWWPRRRSWGCRWCHSRLPWAITNFIPCIPAVETCTSLLLTIANMMTFPVKSASNPMWQLSKHRFNS